MDVDYLVVGSGITGATIARLLKDTGYNVVVADRRQHIAGNIYDYTHESGIKIHAYGPHYFRTNDENIWSFVNRFTAFYKYEPSLRTLVDGKFENWPITKNYIEREVGVNWLPSFVGQPTNFEEASLSIMPEKIYRKFIKGYTEKQWGVKADSLSADLAKRFDIREDGDVRLMLHKYQGIPVDGYTAFVNNLLTNIPVVLNYTYQLNQTDFKVKFKVIYTGPIDELFDYKLGKLKYRGQKRQTKYEKDKDYIQPVGQINNPDKNNGEYVRSIEWKHIMPKKFADNIKGTIITTETPYSPENSNEYEYPFPDSNNKNLYEKYHKIANDIKDRVVVCGRLGEYRYYDMDHAIKAAMDIFKALNI